MKTTEHAPIDDLTPAELRRVLEMVLWAHDQEQTLLLRALAVVESAYACPEWVQHHRTERTDETLELIRKALTRQVKIR